MSARQSYAQRRASRRSSRSSDLLHPHLLDLATRARAGSEVSSSSFGAASGSLTGVGSSAGGDGRGTASACGPGMGGHETIVSPIPQRILSPSSIPTSPPLLPPSLPNPNPAQTLSKTNPQTRQKPTHKHPDAPIKNLIRSLSHSLPTRWVLLVCLAFVLLIKLLVGLGGYSGQNAPPRYGDFEAQRYWMDLTVNVPLGVGWYEVGGVGEGDWWRLDYPPVTAYISWIYGQLGHLLLPSSFSGDLSRGAESPELKSFMRWTVVGLEMCSWWPVVCLWGWRGGRSKRTRVITITSILLHPSLILIDNGHFQYNAFPLSLTLLSVHLFQRGSDLTGAICFSLGLLFKQMGLYWSVAVFGYLMGKCVWLGGKEGTYLFLKLGAVTSLTFLIVLSPFLRPFPSAPLTVLARVFPLARGIFEDKVANFWCASNVVFKWKNTFGAGAMAKLATLATLIGISPTLFVLLWTSYRLRLPPASHPHTRSTQLPIPPTAPLIPLTLFTSSMAFFLFSFQVHEKSVLVPMLSVLMLLGERGVGEGTGWDAAVGLLNVATFSMYPLLKRDRLTLQYVVWNLGWNWLVGYNPLRVTDLKLRWLGYIVYGFIIAHHTLECFLPAPARYPDIYPVTNVLLSFSIFTLAWLVALYKTIEMSVRMVAFGNLGGKKTGAGVAAGEKKRV